MDHAEYLVLSVLSLEKGKVFSCKIFYLQNPRRNLISTRRFLPITHTTYLNIPSRRYCGALACWVALINNNQSHMMMKAILLLNIILTFQIYANAKQMQL